MTWCKHSPRPLFIRPADEVGRVDYLLAHLADYVCCANCGAIGSYSHHALRRLYWYTEVDNQEYVSRKRREAQAWNSKP